MYPPMSAPLAITSQGAACPIRIRLLVSYACITARGRHGRPVQRCAGANPNHGPGDSLRRYMYLGTPSGTLA